MRSDVGVTVSNPDTKADVARGDQEDVPPLSSSSQTGHFTNWKRAKGTQHYWTKRGTFCSALFRSRQ
jgi:hypothetical protein